MAKADPAATTFKRYGKIAHRKGDTMQSSQLESYLNRMGMSAPLRPSVETLRQIQEKHIYSIPVENLDIVNGRLPLSLQIDDLVDKVVNRRRGGLSFELNVLLGDALRDLGFNVKLMSAKHPRYGNEFDHAFLLVAVPGDDDEWIVDVGFTEGFRTPLLFDGRIWQSDGRDEYTVRPADSHDGEAGGERPEAPDGQDREQQVWELLRRRARKVELVYSFTLQERDASDYVSQCEWFCTNEHSRFTQAPFVFIERPEGRICLSADTVFNTFTGEQIRPIIASDEEASAVLREIFGIETDEEPAGEQDGEKFSYGRVFAAVGDDRLWEAVVEKAVSVAIDREAHLRFGHIVNEESRSEQGESFPAYVQAKRESLSKRIADKLKQLDANGELLGGEVVVMGLNSRIGATIDTPVNYPPDQLVESMIKPFNPDIVICGTSGRTGLRSFFHGNTSSYLKRKLDCEVLPVTSS